MYVNSYDLFLDLDFRNLKFEGRALIELETDHNVVLNSLDLNIKNVRDDGTAFRFKQKGENLVVETGSFSGKLEVKYSGSISDAFVGIYRAPYNNMYLVTTQFEATHTRRMFPCVDHPAYKAEFNLTLRIEKDLDAISNMPIESMEDDGDKKIITFQKTPRMSTYLLYLGVGHFEEIKERLDHTDVIVATVYGKAKKGKFALEVAKKAVEYYETYFDIPYMLPKIHLIAVPEFAASAMENWGAITFREAALLVDHNSSVKTKKRVAEVVAHELAHQWFGNLVTLKWWNDLWLNESFATFMAYKVIDQIYSHWRVWEDFVRSRTSAAMGRDSLRNTHPIQVEIKSPSEIEQAFDEISYSKGACILRMIEEYIGADAFTKGIRNYLARHKFSNAAGNDLWDSLEETSGKQVKTIMKKWTQKDGYPVVTAEVDADKLLLKQERFLLSGEIEKDIWPIPIVIRSNSQLKQVLLEKEEEAFTITSPNFLELNVDRTGFYRVFFKGLYDLICRVDLSSLDRWGMISDALAFLLAARISFSDYLSILQRYRSERHILPPHEVSDQLSLLFSIMPSEVADVSQQFHISQLKVLETKTDENSLMLRGIVAGRLAMVDDSYAKNLGSRFLDYEKVEPNMRQAAAVAFARAYGNFEEILRKYRESGSDEEKVRLLVSMMSFKEPSLVALSLGLALSGEVKRQDVGTMILAAAENPDARDVTWMWVKANMERLRKLYDGTGTLSRILLSVIPILGIGRCGEVEKFFKEKLISEAESGIEAGLEKLKIYDKLARQFWK